MSAKLTASCPALEVLDDPSILVEKKVQELVINNESKGEIAQHVVKLGSLRRAVATLSSLCGNVVAEDKKVLFDSIAADAKQSLNHGRTAVGVDFFLEEMNKLDMEKMTSSISQKWASDIEVQFNKKGCKLPSPIRSFLAEMKATGLAEKAEPEAKKIKAEE